MTAAAYHLLSLSAAAAVLTGHRPPPPLLAPKVPVRCRDRCQLLLRRWRILSAGTNQGLRDGMQREQRLREPHDRAVCQQWLREVGE